MNDKEIAMPFIKSTPERFTITCNSPEHNPPSMIVLPSGTHTWKCPLCGNEQTIVIHGVTL